MSTAAGWEAWADWNERQHRDVIAWLCRDLEPATTVLDLASGVGQPALEAARRVAPGRVIATDVAADMLAGLERRARRAGLANIELRELDMHALRGIDDTSIDAVTLAFALMFSPEPMTPLREIGRVLRPRGRLAIAVWDEPARNPFFTTLFGSLGRVLAAPAPVAGSPGPFGLAPPGALERVLRETAFTDIVVEPVPMAFVFDSFDHYWQVTTALAAPLKRAAEGIPDSVRELRAALGDALAPYRDGDRLRVPATALCARCRKA